MTPITPAGRRSVVRLALPVGAHIALVLAVAAWVGRAHPPRGGLVLDIAALAPVVPLVAAVREIGRYMAWETETDQRAVQVEAMLWATGVTFGIATAWGVLEQATLVPHVPSYFAFTVFCIVMASVQVARRLVGPARQVGTGIDPT